jgi:hypothetical protein
LNCRVLSGRQELARFREEQVRIQCSTEQLGAEPRGTHLRRDRDDHDRWPLDGELTDTLHPSPRAFRAVVPTLSLGETPPSSGWAYGPDGLFHDGVKIAAKIWTQIGRTDAPEPYLEMKYVPLEPSDG